MSLTSNFDFCIEIGVASVREIFHLAFKSEDRYPHNVGPLSRTLSGREFQIEVRVLDDEDDAADLEFEDEKHIRFTFPFEIVATTEDAPDPSLSRITLRARAEVPALLTSWVEGDGEVLGLSFFDVTPADVTVPAVEGLPAIDAGRFAAAIHSRYETIQHVYELGGNTLILYDGNRDTSLEPPNEATPFEITAAIETHGGADFLKVTAPIHVDVPLPGDFGTYLSYGRVIFWRAIASTESSVTVDMGAEPADPALATTVELDNAHPARGPIIDQLTPLVVSTLAGYGVITEPAFTEAGARALIEAEVAAYLATRRYPVYSPESGDPEQPLETPVGFLLVGPGILAVLLNRRDSSVEDHAPDAFLGGGELALAVGRAKVDEIIAEAIDEEFPGLKEGGHTVTTDEGEATLQSLSVVPSDAGSHDVDEGHLWVEGEAEVHIDCWPDPDVSFEGPIFVDAAAEESEEGCTLTLEPSAGDFDIDQSCCDVLIDLIIPIVGWIMLGIVESTIDEVGGELIADITEAQGDVVAPIPPVINGIAEVTGCLKDLEITSQGFILPGDLHIRRLGTSFEDRAADGDLPRP